MNTVGYGRFGDEGVPRLRVPAAKVPRAQAAEAHRLVAGGHVRGEVGITLR